MSRLVTVKVRVGDPEQDGFEFSARVPEHMVAHARGLLTDACQSITEAIARGRAR